MCISSAVLSLFDILPSGQGVRTTQGVPGAGRVLPKHSNDHRVEMLY